MPTQHYDSHYDSFSEKDFGKQYSQRIATFLLFLNDVEEGGETVFKREGRDSELDPRAQLAILYCTKPLEGFIALF